MEFQIDASGPIYRQLVEQILARIKTGELQPGDRLPTERELAAQLGVARGTVKKAYRELADNNIIEVIQGSGSYVYDDRDVFNSERRRIAMQLVDETIAKLDLWDFSVQEIETMLRISLAKRERTDRLVRVAVVDCNPESLSIFKKQLLYIPGISISVFLVESIILDDDPKALLADFDLVLTTVTHYGQIAQSLAGSGVKLLQVAMAPSRHTIVSITTLPKETAIGIVCSSNKFANLITEQLTYFLARQQTFDVNFETDLQSTIRFIQNYGAIVVSPDSLLFEPTVSGGALERYEAAGGRGDPLRLPDRAGLPHPHRRAGGPCDEGEIPPGLRAGAVDFPGEERYDRRKDRRHTVWAAGGRKRSQRYAKSRQSLRIAHRCGKCFGQIHQAHFGRAFQRRGHHL